jgi:hypothetical protein
MNWRRGLFRAWLALSALWISVTLWEASKPDLLDQFAKASRIDTLTRNLSEPNILLWVIGPPSVALGLGVLLLWILSGFAARNSN